MKIALGSDHGGFELKGQIKSVIQHLGHEIKDVGCYSTESVNYPEIGRIVVGLVASGKYERGILICGTGIGMSIMANRNFGVRAALCHELYTARLSREHNDANILCMGGRVLGPAIAEEIVKIWLSTPFAGGRHACRLAMIDQS